MEQNKNYFHMDVEIFWSTVACKRLFDFFSGPQLVVHAYGIDFRGVDIIRGYGVTHVPMVPGR